MEGVAIGTALFVGASEVARVDAAEGVTEGCS
jgi:hypothetical protein